MVSAWTRAGGGGKWPLESPSSAAAHRDQGNTLAVSVAAVACHKLRHSGYPALADVECVFARGVLTLWGFVPSFYLKQIAQTAVRDVDQVEEIVNCLEVDPSR